MNYSVFHQKATDFLRQEFDIVQIDSFPDKVRFRTRQRNTSMWSTIFEHKADLMASVDMDEERCLAEIKYKLKNSLN